MDEFKPRSIEVIIEQAHMFGIEGEELREFVLNQQKLDLERLELERKAIEVVKLKMELEVKLSLQGDVPYKIEIENDLSTNEEQNNCRDIVNINGIEDNEEIENVLTSKELNDCNYTVYDINEIDIGEAIENVLTTKELIDKELIDCQFIDNNIIHVLRPFHRVHKPLKSLNLTKGVYQVVGGGKVKPDPKRLLMFLYLKLPRKRKEILT
ncbi:reticulocyte-binding protein PFD0110w-like isoform X1 [Biomphalaria pfeifferi]|uniref:Reticulocyte-binding protein PFD0110w-like isoform X1 n=1 Tax=Biomphalaria pfeifferi TaxID=112525 RepID=A0AAD8BG00_BIOPF|nr:reticulocyte-binding protein PFD0110w-like isoform X1 [Biomphalaria pfeifferi]